MAPGKIPFRMFGVDLGGLSAASQFFICTVGLFGFLLINGHLEEKVTKEYFRKRFPLFVAFARFACSAVFAVAEQTIAGSIRHRSATPFLEYLKLAGTMSISMALTVRAYPRCPRTHMRAPFVSMHTHSLTHVRSRSGACTAARANARTHTRAHARTRARTRSLAGQASSCMSSALAVCASGMAIGPARALRMCSHCLPRWCRRTNGAHSMKQPSDTPYLTASDAHVLQRATCCADDGTLDGA